MKQNITAVILAGGFGTRYNKNSRKKILKPLVKINKTSVLERIINIYFNQGIRNFILLGGYKFQDLQRFAFLLNKKRKLNIKAIFTGLRTETAGRLLKIKSELKNEKYFFFTYGDSLASFNVKSALKLKTNSNYIISTFNLNFPYGNLEIKKNNLIKINEKNHKIKINAGFYILDNSIFNNIKSIKESFEKKTINSIIKKKRKKFISVKLKNWMPMDNENDRLKIESELRKNAKLFN